VISKVIPGADSSAGERRLIEVAALLAERASVDVVAAGGERPVDEAQRIRALRSEAVNVPFGGGPVHLVRLLMGRRYDLILAESWTVAELARPHVRRHQPYAVFAVDTVDLHFLRDARAGELVGEQHPSQARNRQRELDTYHGADVRIFVSDVEREMYEAVVGGRRDHNPVVPIIVAPPCEARKPARHEVVFVGGLWHPPNMDGVFWFCSEVWPAVRVGAPGARLRLIGSNAWSLPIDTGPLEASPGVAVEGFVADLGPVYAGATAVIAPLRFGAGMKGKVCEAMAAGAPVVTTTIGAEGIRAQPGRDLLVADGAESFAAAVVSLLTDDALNASVATAGAAAIEAQCGIEVVRPVVHQLLSELGSDASASASAGAAARPSRARPARTRDLPRAAVAAGWRFFRRLQARCQQGGT
jgi:glycosyltransferase involved in cell wall biosynthesis